MQFWPDSISPVHHSGVRRCHALVMGGLAGVIEHAARLQNPPAGVYIYMHFSLAPGAFGHIIFYRSRGSRGRSTPSTKPSLSLSFIDDCRISAGGGLPGQRPSSAAERLLRSVMATKIQHRLLGSLSMVDTTLGGGGRLRDIKLLPRSGRA